MRNEPLIRGVASGHRKFRRSAPSTNSSAPFLKFHPICMGQHWLIVVLWSALALHVVKAGYSQIT